LSKKAAAFELSDLKDLQLINLLVGSSLQWSLEVAHWEERRQPASVPTGVDRR